MESQFRRCRFCCRTVTHFLLFPTPTYFTLVILSFCASLVCGGCCCLHLLYSFPNLCAFFCYASDSIYLCRFPFSQFSLKRTDFIYFFSLPHAIRFNALYCCCHCHHVAVSLLPTAAIVDQLSLSRHSRVLFIFGCKMKRLVLSVASRAHCHTLNASELLSLFWLPHRISIAFAVEITNGHIALWHRRRRRRRGKK